MLFYLSPNDLVYVPKQSENMIELTTQSIDRNRLYKMVSCTGDEGHFIPINIASPIVHTKELGSNNKAQRAWTKEMIKGISIPIKVDRLGNITEINGKKV